MAISIFSRDKNIYAFNMILCKYSSVLHLNIGLQAYQVELESIAVRLEEENELLMKEKVLHFSPFSQFFIMACYKSRNKFYFCLCEAFLSLYSLIL